MVLFNLYSNIKCELISREAFSRRKHADNIDFTRIDFGMRFRDLKVGTSSIVANAGSHVTVHYTAHTLHGRLVDDSHTCFSSGISFIAGESGLVPPVLHRGVLGMSLGTRREIIAPPAAHFPEQFPRDILIYEINLVKVGKVFSNFSKI
jgi:FKBP-type peptidyl-prolyl cis-trans isomerase